MISPLSTVIHIGSQPEEPAVKMLGRGNDRVYIVQMRDNGVVDDDRKARPHIGIFFRCCRIYSRIYLNHRRTAFVGWCPRCAAKIEVKVSPTGSPNRFFFAE